MPDQDTPPELSSEEIELIRKRRSNPMMAAGLDLVMKQFDEEIRRGVDAHQAEESALKLLQQLGQTMLGQWAQHTECQHLDETRTQNSTLQKHAKKKLCWNTTLGPIELTVQILRQGRRGKTFCPFEEFTAISARSCSHPLQRRIVDFYAERSGEKTIVALQEHYGITVSLHAVQNISREAATRAKALNSQVPTQSAPTSKTLIAQLDGSMVPVINFGEVDQTQAAAVSEDRRKKRQTCWKELRLCTVTAQGRDFTRYGVSRGSPFEVGCMMNNTCRHEGMTEQTHIHGVADGATWIAEQFERQFGTRHSFLLDFYHACQYLSAASAKVSQNKEMQTCWYQKQKKAFLAGEVKEVLAELEKHIDLSGDQENDSVSICLRYLGKRCEQLDYPSAKAAKLPIGSGEVESGHRHILQQRLKIPGAWWKIETADEMAHLRVLRANDRWNELWQQDAA